MEEKLYEKEENTEELEAAKTEEGGADDEAEKVEWSAVKKPRSEKRDETTAAEEIEIPEPQLEVIPEDEIVPVEKFDEDFEGKGAALLAAESKQARKAARKEVKQNTKDYEDDGSIFKMKPIRNTMNLVYLLLLIAAIGIPVGLLAYTIMTFFL